MNSTTAVTSPALGTREQAIWERLERGETVVVNYRTDNDLIARATEAGLFVRIDRRSRWGNPFELPGDGSRGVVIANYAEHYLPFKSSLSGRLRELRGKALGCWCAPAPCHGDILKWIVDSLGNDDDG